jgi:hypothetical protein
VRFLLDNDVPDVVARVLVQAGNALVLITCNRGDFIPLASARAHSGLIILIRRRSRILECAKLLRLLEAASESGLAGNINFA